MQLGFVSLVAMLVCACSAPNHHAELVTAGSGCPVTQPAVADAGQVAVVVDAATPDASAQLLTCMSENVEILSTIVRGETFSFCIRKGRGEETGGDKGCFAMDLATGAVSPAPVAWGALDTIRTPEQLPQGFTASENEDNNLVLCSAAGKCTPTRIATADDHERYGVSDDGVLVYVVASDDHGDYVLLHRADGSRPPVFVETERLAAALSRRRPRDHQGDLRRAALFTELRDRRWHQIAVIGSGKDGADELGRGGARRWRCLGVRRRRQADGVSEHSHRRDRADDRLREDETPLMSGSPGLVLVGREHGFVGISARHGPRRRARARQPRCAAKRSMPRCPGAFESQ